MTDIAPDIRQRAINALTDELTERRTRRYATLPEESYRLFVEGARNSARAEAMHTLAALENAGLIITERPQTCLTS